MVSGEMNDALLLNAVDALVFSRLPACKDDYSTLTACLHPRHFIRLVFDTLSQSCLLRPYQLNACLETLGLPRPSSLDCVCFSLHDFEHILCKQYCTKQGFAFRQPPLGNIYDISVEDVFHKLEIDSKENNITDTAKVLTSLERLRSATSLCSQNLTGSEDILESLGRENLVRTVMRLRDQMAVLKNVLEDVSLKLQSLDANKLAMHVTYKQLEKEWNNKCSSLEERNEKLKQRLHELIEQNHAREDSPTEPLITASLTSEVFLENGQLWRRTRDVLENSQSSSDTSVEGGSDFLEDVDDPSPPPCDPCTSYKLPCVSKSFSSPAAHTLILPPPPVLSPLKPCSSAQDLKNKLSTITRKLKQAETRLIKVIAPKNDNRIE